MTNNMCSLVISVLICLGAVYLSTCVSYQSYRLSTTDYSYLKNYMGQNIIGMYSEISISRCVQLCAVVPQCFSISYNQNGGIENRHCGACVLLKNKRPPDNIESVEGIGLIFIALRNWGREDRGSCSNNTCLDGEICLPSGETYTCKHIVCEDNPRVQNAEFTDVERFPDPQIRLLTCKIGYTVQPSSQVYGLVRCDELLNEWMCVNTGFAGHQGSLPVNSDWCEARNLCKWTLMFRAVAGSGQSIKDAYLYGTGVTNLPQCKDGWNPNCTGIYRSHLLDRLENMNVASIAITVYPTEMANNTYSIYFKGDGSKKESWFEEGTKRLFESPWGPSIEYNFKAFNSSDLPGQFLTIMKDDQQTDPCSSLAFSVFDAGLPECLTDKAGSLNPPYIVMFDTQNKPLFHQHIVIWAEFK